MSDEGPKLFDHKPKKSKLKAAITASPAASATAPPPPPPLQQPPTPPAPPVKFYKGLAVVISLVAGAYVFARTVLKVGVPREEKPEDPIPTTSTSSSITNTSATTDTAVAITGQPVTLPTVIEPIQRPPIPEAQQRELLKWILEEKRKAKPRDADEKKRIDEEKAVLKQLIKSKSIPTI